MKKIAIMAVPNGVGISRDCNIISSLLKTQGYEVGVFNMFKVVPKDHSYDLAIFLERFNPRSLNVGIKRAFIPNQEWFEAAWVPIIRSFDLVLAKTRFAEKLFSELDMKTEFISFTSEDRYLPNVQKDDYHWLHIAGKSIQKQTNVVIETWTRNPGFPSLTIIQDPKFFRPRGTLRNVNFVTDHYPDEVLKTMQNSFAFHVCPSETEGFGHYIMEAMSTKSVVITTDAPPMSEIVSRECGVLIPYITTRRMNLSTSYIVSPETLEKTVVKAMILMDKRVEMGEKARSFYLQNDTFFKDKFVKTINALLS
jgi:glycosyltransferase involved in cell wall biosynthesis